MSHRIVRHFLSCRAHPRSGSVQTSPTSTPASNRRGRQLPQLPPTGKDRSKSPWFFSLCIQDREHITAFVRRRDKTMSLMMTLFLYVGPTDWGLRSSSVVLPAGGVLMHQL